MTIDTDTLAYDAATRTRTCSLCGDDFLADDTAARCPNTTPPYDGPHVASTKRRLTVTSLTNIAMLDELGDQHPVGIAEIAHALGVKRQTVDAWKWRDWFPQAQPTTLGSRPFWLWGDVRAWAVRTGRIIEQPTGEGDGDGDTVTTDVDATPAVAADGEVPVTKIGPVRHPRTAQRDEGDDA